MTIRLDYNPVTDLANLARAAGEGVGARQRTAADLAFQQSVFNQQAKYAEIAARSRAQDRAFDLQEAAASRIARTPTRAGPTGPKPDSVLGRMQWTKGVQEQQQQEKLTNLEGMRQELGEEEYLRIKRVLLTGVTSATPRPEDQIKPRLTQTQEYRLVLDPFTRRRRRIEDELELEKGWLSAANIPIEEKIRRHRTVNSLNKQIADLNREQGEAVDEFKRRSESKVVDPLTGQATPGADPQEGVLAPTGPADTLTGQLSPASVERAIAEARMYFLERGVRNPSKADLRSVTRALLAR